MTDIINLNSIRSDNCDCNKPKPEKHQCGCNNHNTQPCHQVTDQGDQYFKVKNLFGELKSEWQRTEARSNLGVTDIIDFKQIKFGEGSGDTNIWQMLTSKGGSQKTYDFIVANGEKGESATIEIIDLEALSPEANPTFTNIGTPSHAKYILGIPRGHNGLSAYQIYQKNGGTLPEEDWLLSLKGEDGSEGPGGPAGPMGPAGADSDMYQPTSIIPLRVDNNQTLDISDGNVFQGDLLVYKMVLKNGQSLYFSTPYKIIGGGGPQQYKYNLFMFKLVDFETKPSEAWIASTISELRQQIDNKTKEELEVLQWSTSAPRVDIPSEQFIFMATCVVTNGEYGDWSVVCLTGAKGNPGADGTSGEGEQGLMGPVIRISTYDNNNPQRCYKNQATVTEGYNLTDIRYIDVVYYDDSNPNTSNFWTPKPQLSKNDCAYGPPNKNTWDEAQGYDFLFVQTLIANYLSAYTVDTSEVRIHTNLGQDGDTIVAGMTGGKNVLNTPEVLNDSSNPVRIWAGNETSVHDTSMNIANAPFRVYQNGHLFANDADIEGTVQANILRLGEGSFLDCSNRVTFNGHTYFAVNQPESATLPPLMENKVQMYYILTDHINTSVTVYAYRPGSNEPQSDRLDTISFLNATTGTLVENQKSVVIHPKKLYQFFGVDKVWRVCEINLAPIAVSNVSGGIVDPSNYTCDLELTFDDTVEWVAGAVDQQHGIIVPRVTLELSITNNFISDITVYIPSITLNVYYSTDGQSQINTEAQETEEIQQNTAYTLSIHRTGISVNKHSSVEDTVSSTSNQQSAGGFQGNYLSMEIQKDDTPGYTILQDYSNWYPTLRSDIPEQTPNVITGSGKDYKINESIISATY